MIARVIPATKLPRSLDVFDYAVPDALLDHVRRGTLVRIPFRSRLIMGLVESLHDSDREKLKSIAGIATPFCFSEGDLALLDWLRDTCFISRGHGLLLMRQFIPRGMPAQTLAETPADVRSPSPELVSFGTTAERNTLLVDILQSRHKKGLALILAPTVSDVVRLLPILRARLGDHSASLLTSASRTSEVQSAINSIWSGKTKILFGTRVSLFAPLPSLETLILLDTERDEYKQADLNPRYDARSLAIMRAKKAGARCLFFSTAPRLQDSLALQEGLFTEPRHGAPRTRVPISVADLSTAWRSGRFDLITDELEEELARVCVRNDSAFLFLNRTGTARLVVCKDCEFLFACQHCLMPLHYHKTENLLRCPSGHDDTQLPSACPQCRSVRFVFRGFGTERVAATLKELFPDARVIEYAKGTPPPAADTGSQKKGMLIVGTCAVPNEMPEAIERARLIAFLAADPLILPHDFRAVERQWQQAARILSHVTRGDARVILQAFHPESLFVQTLRTNDYETFARTQLTERKQFSLPPYSRRVTIRIKRLGRVASVVEKTLSDLKERCARLEPPIKTSTVDDGGKEIRVTLRVDRDPANPSKVLPQDVVELLASLPPYCLIDAEPLSL
ncbi:MAG: hypothetical protein AAB416_01155 [Patescibacteria group bacterium]